MVDNKDSELDYVDMLARPDLCHIKVGERRIDLTPAEAKAVALLLQGFGKLRWKADDEGYPVLVEPGERRGRQPTKPVPAGLCLRPLAVAQPPEADRYGDRHRAIAFLTK